ncbi:hypothetical protein HAZT_HAZT003213 [Hyalella azteca]|uniref:ShKT domain-containing protein n=1 Tax=Hyalella azteca TaxID=294128 RepID=A0A6A0H6W9_HYAAZ|nr:hypothetical protein HAZT_HAZT003213 [Hyalella azteca]
MISIFSQVPGLCLDTDRHCASWAQMGQCTENPAWMMLHCRQSCHRCAGPLNMFVVNLDSKCVDLNEKCADWRATGQCELNAPYMHLYCMKSCQLCAGSGQCQECVYCEETGKTQECTNSNKKCGLWASQGDCVRYPGYMNRYCRKSCVQC